MNTRLNRWIFGSGDGRPCRLRWSATLADGLIVLSLTVSWLWSVQAPVRAQVPADFGLSWISSDQRITASIAWGDIEGDGDLDLAVGNLRGWDGTEYIGGENQL